LECQPKKKQNKNGRAKARNILINVLMVNLRRRNCNLSAFFFAVSYYIFVTNLLIFRPKILF
jgi:hypothetical protein